MSMDAMAYMLRRECANSVKSSWILFNCLKRYPENRNYSLFLSFSFLLLGWDGDGGGVVFFVSLPLDVEDH